MYKCQTVFKRYRNKFFFLVYPQGSEEEKDVKAEKSVTISGKNMTDITYAVELINLRVREWMRINAERISMNVKSNVTAEVNGKIRKMVSSDLAAVRGDPYGGYSGILNNQNININSVWASKTVKNEHRFDDFLKYKPAAINIYLDIGSGDAVDRF